MMRFAYADPPYPGMAYIYRYHPDYAGEVDHRALIDRLVAEFTDGWALSTKTSALQDTLTLCPPGVRVLAWLRPGVALAGGYPQCNWEPVILCGGRKPKRTICSDWLQLCYQSGGRTGRELIGSKPEAFCFWLFRCLGALPGDELVDLFPGSGAVGRAWDKYQRQMTLPMEREPLKQARF